MTILYYFFKSTVLGEEKFHIIISQAFLPLVQIILIYKPEDFLLFCWDSLSEFNKRTGQL